MQFGYTILYVDDVTASLGFYEKGLGLAVKYVDPTASFAELDTGATSLSLCSRRFLEAMGKKVASPSRDTATSEIAFVTDDPAAALARAVAAGAVLVQSPEEMSWGQTTAYVRDPDGFLIEFCTPMAA